MIISVYILLCAIFVLYFGSSILVVSACKFHYTFSTRGDVPFTRLQPSLNVSREHPVAERPRDASCMSVVGFNSTIRQAQSSIISQFSFRFIAAYK